MKNQFNDELHQAFEDKLGNIHASEDLINRTLNQIKLEFGDDSENTVTKGTLSPISNKYIKHHVDMHRKFISRRKKLIIITAVAACFLVLNAAVLAFANKAFVNTNTIEEVTTNTSHRRYTNPVRVLRDENGAHKVFSEIEDYRNNRNPNLYDYNVNINTNIANINTLTEDNSSTDTIDKSN